MLFSYSISINKTLCLQLQPYLFTALIGFLVPSFQVKSVIILLWFLKVPLFKKACFLKSIFLSLVCLYWYLVLDPSMDRQTKKQKKNKTLLNCKKLQTFISNWNQKSWNRLWLRRACGFGGISLWWRWVSTFAWFLLTGEVAIF